ncbi:alpha-D-ribose 1-methylphosphonate 5-triphosphate diphosphatase [Paenibacillus sp. XY044]|uniref:alpha-D-ribose 1-methylphosphonate 5-triphosphate diphosphatase n=1 Tax=Paenibacillus sp. XY044 TaxID=2026089 RepID=UPI000B9867A5|nr:alpha-D-ribose 1-methylphosphonate 5-triphosphate diphosphatase [Paenibacillus sp. XY044]OZB92427.1 alpha-D-ribose 1-methylphosphonate 5-triphosphate diphosphatase [Paenibacillus sp. XY044]
MGKQMIYNGMIVTPERMFQGVLFVSDRKIAEIKERDGSVIPPGWEDAQKVDASGCYVLPGIIDLHGDFLEKAIEPRKGVLMPVSLGLHTVQSYLLAAGITTMFHGISFVGETGIRSNEMGYEIACEIYRLRKGKEAKLRHHLHVRYELINDKGIDWIFQLMDKGMVDLLSIMDHTPQYGKYRTLDEYRYYVEKTYQLTGEACDRFIEEQRKKRELIDHHAERKLIERALAEKIPVASHDDDTPAKVEELRGKGITISEFPLNDATCQHVQDLGMFAVVGGPNVYRGYSHENHISARHVLQKGWANIICSDYYPFSILSAVFELFDEGMSLSEAVSFASLFPARALGWEDRLGSIETGKEADLILVDRSTGKHPSVVGAMVNGEWTLMNGSQTRD